MRIAEYRGLHLTDPARTTVQLLRQVPIVALSRYTSLSLFRLGQVFTFVLLALPPFSCALCWVIAPRDRKVWILFPIIFLLTAFAATSFHAIGEASIATAYFWVLLFLLLFRTYSFVSRILFLALSLPAIQLHEGAFPLSAVVLMVCVWQWFRSREWQERLFISASFLGYVAILVYQISWIISPNTPADRAAILGGLWHLAFLHTDGHFNLPLITGSFSLLILVALFIVSLATSADQAAKFSAQIVGFWIVLALGAIALAIGSDASFSPFAQLQARYQPVCSLASFSEHRWSCFGCSICRNGLGLGQRRYSF
jgi:hypothetical protein